jgi:hypothetical protein
VRGALLMYSMLALLAASTGAMAAAVLLLVTAPPPKAYSSSNVYDFSSVPRPAPTGAAVNSPVVAATTSFSSRPGDGSQVGQQEADEEYWARVRAYEPWALQGDGQRPTGSAALTSHSAPAL